MDNELIRQVNRKSFKEINIHNTGLKDEKTSQKQVVHYE